MPARPCVSIAAISLALCAPAFAQNPAAEGLFNDGEKLMKQGKLAQACDAFAASNKIEPRAGTLIGLGQCREANHQLASAWSAYKDAFARAKDPRKKKYAEDRIAALEPKLSHLTISVVDRADGLAITRNGTPIDPVLWSRAEPIDGGDYEIIATAPGRVEWRSKVTVPVERGEIKVDVPKLEPVEVKPQPPGQSPQVQPQSPQVQPQPQPRLHPPGGTDRSTWTGKRKAAVATGVVAVASLGTGIALGVIANKREEQALALCMVGVPCADAAKARSLNLEGHRLAIGANVSFGVAGVATVGAALLWLTGAPVTPTANGVAVVGEF